MQIKVEEQALLWSRLYEKCFTWSSIFCLWTNWRHLVTCNKIEFRELYYCSHYALDKICEIYTFDHCPRVSTKRRPKTEDRRPKKDDPNFFARIRHGQLKNQAKAFLSANRCENNGDLRFVEKTPWIYKTKTLTKTLCQTPIDAKSMGSSFCRKSPLNL